MSKRWLGFVGLCVTLSSIGCANNSSVSGGQTRSGRFFGDLGIRGSENNWTVETGSELRRLSVWGDANRITVQYGARISKVEVFGKNNIIMLPKYLIVRHSVIGGNNQFLDTPRDQYSGYQGYYSYRYGQQPAGPVMTESTMPAPSYEPAPAPTSTVPAEGGGMVPVGSR